MNPPFLVVGLLFLILAVLTLFRKKKNSNYTRIGRYDQEDTIFVKVFLRLWGLIPDWLSALILFTIGMYIITLAV